VDVARPIATIDLVEWDGEGPDAQAWHALAAALAMLGRREDVRCIVLGGAGSPGGLAGAAPEPTTSPAGTGAGARAGADPVALTLRALRSSRHPIVALVEGACTAWQLEVATCCDLRICGETSHFGAPIEGGRLGGVYGEVRPLAQLLGPTPALDRVLAGEWLGAERALALGLVNRVVPDAAVAEHAHGLAARIAAGAPLLNRWHKQVVRRLYGGSSFAH
jgi:enoyl-CoA hydratase/carnithine racemase